MKEITTIKFLHKTHKNSTDQPNRFLLEVINLGLAKYCNDHYDKWEIIEVTTSDETEKQINNDSLK